MFDFLHSTKNGKEETALVFALESGKAITGIVRLKPNKKPEIVYAHQSAVLSEAKTEGSVLSFSLASLKRENEKLQKEGIEEVKAKGVKFGDIKTAYVFLGSPWNISKIVTSTKTEDKPFIITNELIRETASEHLKEKEPNLLHIEEAIVSVKANGYEIENSIGKKTSSITVTSFISTMNEDVAVKIKEVINLAFPNLLVNFHTIPMAFFPIVVNLLHKKDFVLCMPEHEVSEFLLVRGGVPKGSVSIPFGKHFPVRVIASALQKEKETVLSLLSLHEEGTLEASAETELTQILSQAESEWDVALTDAFWRLGETFLLPKEVIIAGKDAESKILETWISKKTFANKSFSSDTFSVSYFTTEDVKNYIVVSSSKEPHPILGAISLFLKTL